VLALNFPQYTFKIRHGKESLEIFCLSRKKWLILTPEEWVRQHALAHLIHYGNYSPSWMRAEVKWNDEMGLRSDIVVYRQDGTVWGIVECKAPQVGLNEEVSHQVMVYAQKGSPDWVIITNGLHHIIWDNRSKGWKPDWPMNTE
jgi:predicted type IV restriction endonuclease